MHRRRIRLLAAAATCGLIPLVPATSEAAQPRPGDITRTEPSAFRLAPHLPTPTSAWKVHYRSTDARGRPDTVSGTVVVPKDGRAGPRPLVSYAVGTVGMGDQCAPSATLPQGRTAEAALVNGALLRGWAVALTDYEGLGTPGDHTYTVGRAEGTAVLDAARAAQRLPQAREMGVGEESPVGIMGYSQGGQASAWAAELHRTYAPELKVKGTASGGVPADLEKTALYNNGPGDPDSGLVLMSAIGHDAAFPRLRLNRYLNDEGRRLAAFMRKGCVEENTRAGAGKRIEDVTTRNPLDQPDWQAALRADRLGRTAPDAPVRLYHGGADEIIPYEVGRRLRADWCARGVAVDWQTYPGQKHVGAAVLGSNPAMNWLAGRFADRPAPDNCGRSAGTAQRGQ
ncbi:lipase family protein [Streptomyces sp. ODS28]|uniref:lipase family protein n=1 Tax=Streptomyces sp. ODS28 TaxID=3136688 RepID=UPI0031E55B4A